MNFWTMVRNTAPTMSVKATEAEIYTAGFSINDTCFTKESGTGGAKVLGRLRGSATISSRKRRSSFLSLRGKGASVSATRLTATEAIVTAVAIAKSRQHRLRGSVSARTRNKLLLIPPPKKCNPKPPNYDSSSNDGISKGESQTSWDDHLLEEELLKYGEKTGTYK